MGTYLILNPTENPTYSASLARFAFFTFSKWRLVAGMPSLRMREHRKLVPIKVRIRGVLKQERKFSGNVNNSLIQLK